jgi:hypothetical protein
VQVAAAAGTALAMIPTATVAAIEPTRAIAMHNRISGAPILARRVERISDTEDIPAPFLSAVGFWMLQVLLMVLQLPRMSRTPRHTTEPYSAGLKFSRHKIAMAKQSLVMLF